ncbi:MAG TPA: helix-hairpin-helix domain-containing protein [Polyangia bacterium]|nr:helix-hairpin-helix domain-containing protein [Polyangia bacterium]
MAIRRQALTLAATVAVTALGGAANRSAHAAVKAVDGVVNLNTAPPATLGLLPGVGPAKVQSILDYRRKHPFRTADELVRIKGIGHKMVRRLRPHLAVSGPTTAEAAHGSAVEPPPLPPPRPPERRPLVCPPVIAARPMARPARTPSRTLPTGANHCLGRP